MKLYTIYIDRESMSGDTLSELVSIYDDKPKAESIVARFNSFGLNKIASDGYPEARMEEIKLNVNYIDFDKMEKDMRIALIEMSKKRKTSYRVFGTREWAKYSANACSGCRNNCSYCYSKAAAIKRKQKTIENWTEETPYSKAPYKKWPLKDGTIMFPTTHDITPGNIDVCVAMLHNMLEPGNTVLIVSKPHKECIERLCEALGKYRNEILFRFTIGSANNSVLRLWEPLAPCFDERIAALVFAFNARFNTSISCEPMLDADISHVVDAVAPYVSDAIWLGKMNYPETRLRTNGRSDMLPHAINLIDTWNDERIRALYKKYKNNPLVKWKESIKKIVGIEIPTESGLDK